MTDLTDLSDPEWRVLGDWTEDLLEVHREQISAHDVRLRLELDPHFVVARSPARAAALEGLLRLIFSTTPADSEVYVSCQRRAAPVSRLGEGDWTARWQVLIDDEASAFQSKILARLESSFALAGWALDLARTGSGREFRAQVDCRENLIST